METFSDGKQKPRVVVVFELFPLSQIKLYHVAIAGFNKKCYVKVTLEFETEGVHGKKVG